MTDDKKPPPDDDAAIERDIRSQRRFSIAEAIGRSGGELLKGASPVTRKRQVELELKLHLGHHLADADGALSVVLLRRVIESESMLETGYDRPLDVLRAEVGTLLASDERLEGFVGLVDAEWGRIYSERPFFERDGEPPHQDDPYTVSSVRASLAALLEEPSAESEPGSR